MSLRLFESRHAALESAITRAVLAGAFSGVLRGVLLSMGCAVAVWWPTVLAVCMLGARGDRFDRWLLRVVAGIGLVGCGLMPPSVAVVAGGALAGFLQLWALRCERGASEVLSPERMAPRNYAIGAFLGAGLSPLGCLVADVLVGHAATVAGNGAPLPAGVVSGSIVGLFLGLSTVAGYAALAGNPVERRVAAVMPQLRGEIEGLAQRAVNAYRDCARGLKGLPSKPEREELALTLGVLVTEVLDAAQRWTEIDHELGSGPARAAEERARDMDAAAATTTDALARAHFLAAASTVREEAKLVAELGRRRERLVAKLSRDVALLERARASLVGAKSGLAHVRAAELSGLARKLATSSRVQELDGSAADEVAVEAEVASLAALRA